MLLTAFPAGPLQANCYFVASGPGAPCAIVDPGMQSFEGVEAVVTEVDIDTRLKVNGRSPYRATFRYKTPDGVTRETSSSRMRMRPDLRVPGARVWALYDETKPDRATLWPIE